MAYELSVEELRQRLGPVDKKQVELIVAASPAQRIRAMLEEAEQIRIALHARLRREYPDLLALERCNLMYEKFDQYSNKEITRKELLGE